jgi:hypothetical protein
MFALIKATYLSAVIFVLLYSINNTASSGTIIEHEYGVDIIHK